MTTHSQLLRAAVAFIKASRPADAPGAILRDLMVLACEEAAGGPSLGTPGPRHAVPLATRQLELSPGKSAPSDGITEENARILLKAGGLKRIQRTTIRLYQFLLRGQKRSWSADEVVRSLKCTRPAAKEGMAALCRRNIVKRTERGRYQAS